MPGPDRGPVLWGLQPGDGSSSPRAKHCSNGYTPGVAPMSIPGPGVRAATEPVSR